MKLGTKIMAGYAAICIIFAILVLFIFVLVQADRVGTMELTETILPTSIASSDVLARIGLVSYYSADYYYSGSESSLASSKTEHDAIEVQLNLIMGKFNEPAVQKNPEFMNSITALNKNYPLFYSAVEDIAVDRKAIAISAQQLRTDYAVLVKLCQEILAAQRESQINAFSVGNFTEGESLYERMDAITSIREGVDTMMIAVLRGRQYRVVSYFDEGNVILDTMQEAGQWLVSTAETEQERRLAAEILAITDLIDVATDEMSSAVITSFEHTKTRNDLRDAAMKDSTAVSTFTDRQSIGGLQDSVKNLMTVILSMFIGLAVSVIMAIILATIIIRGISKQVNNLVETLSDGANQVDSASTQLTSSSTTLAEGATENAASLEETSAALEELSSMSKRNADNSTEANALMKQASAAVGQASNSMGDVTTAMEEISISGNKIGKIIKTIDEIAFQTNLLALNAAVEAARAGEAGAGFAVVADEVRNLAIRSADAAKNTSDLIASTISNISSGTEMVNATSENFKVVAKHSSKVAELLAEISEASQEQSQGIGQITTAMTEMDKVTQSNAASAEESASAASQLSQQAGTLLDAVDDLNSLIQGQKGANNRGGSTPRMASPAITATGRLSSAGRSKTKALPQHSSKRAGGFGMDDEFDF